MASRLISASPDPRSRPLPAPGPARLPAMATKKTAKKSAPARRSHTIRLVLDVPNAGPSIALAQLSPSQREWAREATKNGTMTRLVIVFPGSETRDLDEAIRALPGALQGAVVLAEKRG